tara:strand:+ start:4396 stop:4947 length:552 start_codon:yes stop_codon:yes gene_type:complete
MPNLSAYCFKPKHGIEMARKIIEHFCNDFLDYAHEGFYLYWREHDPRLKHRTLPEGWVEFYVDTDCGNLEAWSEVCYQEREVEAYDMTEKFFVLLGEDFWHEDDDGQLQYTMYERELFELVIALSEEGSRSIAWGGDRTTYVSYTNDKGERGTEHVDMLEYVLTTPIKNENKKGSLQFTLDLR